MKSNDKAEIVKELDQIETELTNWGVNKENNEDAQNNQYQDLMLRLEKVVKSLKEGSSNDHQ